jgi:hypothetical protein
MLLPVGFLHHRSDGRARGGLKQCNDPGLF